MKKFLKTIYQNIPLKKQLFMLIKVISIPEFIYKHLYFNGVFRVKVENTSFLLTHFGYQLENEVFWKGLLNGWEKISMRLWVELCKDSTVIFDIGANTGIYSLVAKATKPNSVVFAFEPVKRVYEKLLLNTTLNNYQINCFDFAISNYNGDAYIYDTDEEHIYSVTVNNNPSGNPELIKKKIAVQKLSTFVLNQNINRIDLIKIDVETHEPEVLEGLEEYLSLYKPTILIEILNDDIGRKVEQILSGCEGYLYFNINEIEMPKRVDKITKSDYYNYLICRKDIADKLGLQC